jgi:hypothetical protein
MKKVFPVVIFTALISIIVTLIDHNRFWIKNFVIGKEKTKNGNELLKNYDDI